MREELRPYKTPLARTWLADPANPLDLTTRVLLSTVDGRRSWVELESVARALGLRFGALHRLREQGLLEFGEAFRLQERLAEDSPAVVCATDAPPRLPLPAATWYAVELACVMLGREDADLSDAARGVRTRAALLDWCERCADLLARECGPDRTDVFWDKVCAVLRPREALAAGAEDMVHD